MLSICENCGGIGHTSEQCPSEPQENRDHAMWIKLDNASKVECNEFLKEMVDVKHRCAPKARATYAIAPKKELPTRIKENLALEEKKSDDKEK